MVWEVEQKFSVQKPQELLPALAAFGVTFGPPVVQVDHYFNHPARDFAHTDEALRLRRVGDENLITYKGPRVDPATKMRQEIEIALATGPQVAEMAISLLAALGFRPVGVVRKFRRSGSCHHKGHDIDVALDEVEGLGSFLELELRAEDFALESAKDAIHSLAASISLGPGERRSYLELLMQSR